MGLFDYVRCEAPLPDGYAGELQTKDFDEPYMLTHVITKEGRLMRSVLLRTETVPKANRPYPDEPEDSFISLAGSMRCVTELRDENFHGMFHFGGLETISYEPDDRYGPRGRPIYKPHDYRAKFTDGNLIEIQFDSD